MKEKGEEKEGLDLGWGWALGGRWGGQRQGSAGKSKAGKSKAGKSKAEKGGAG
ncbi:hypothetical protein Acsp05_68570 [Actinokineospora sp. NBRC 105648]|nr:hypothetical protein Acsp05_68570 [Actinokineospora sp. NBRC 105648]